jgi:phenylacetate-CoA ligase
VTIAFKAPEDSAIDGRLDHARLEALCAQMIARDSWPRERLLAYQQERLRELVAHAVANSPYYRQQIGSAGQSNIDLQQLPVLTKGTLMAEFDRIVADRRLRLDDIEEHLASEHAAEPMFGKYRVVGSGGTTGRRGVVVYDQSAWEVVIAGLMRANATQGTSAEARVLGIGAPTPLHMSNRMFAELRAERAHVPRLALTTPLPQVVEALNAYQPEVLITYPSFIRRLAEEQSAGRLRIAPRNFCSGAETLTLGVRNLARDTWQATVLNIYAATEAGVIGAECPWASGIHVAEDLLIVEVVDEENRPVPAGIPGRKVLITNLFNRALPIIRYELSDIATVAEGPCRCGRPHLRLASIQGRREDDLSLPARGGGRVTVNAFLLGDTLLHIPAIRQYQLHPRQRGLLVRVALRDTSAQEEALQSARRAIAMELERVGAVVETLTIEAVDEIARVGNGAKEKLVSASD